MSKPDTRSVVQKYYDYTLPFYKVFWHGETRALHYGIYESPEESFETALLNSNRLLAERAHITKDDVVLDAGCGVGGSALWLARITGAKVKGITVSEKQVKKAKELAVRYGLEEHLEFFQEDFFATHFHDSDFTVVWGIESLCHAHHDIRRFLKEAHRVLKPGGRLVIADGFLGSKQLSEEEQRDVAAFYEGFALEHMISVEEFTRALTESGFTNISYRDVTENILPTARSMHRMIFWWYPVVWILSALRIIPILMKKNSRTSLVQERLFKERALVYGILYAEKK